MEEEEEGGEGRRLLVRICVFIPLSSPFFYSIQFSSSYRPLPSLPPPLPYSLSFRCHWTYHTSPPLSLPPSLPLPQYASSSPPPPGNGSEPSAATWRRYVFPSLPPSLPLPIPPSHYLPSLPPSPLTLLLPYPHTGRDHPPSPHPSRPRRDRYVHPSLPPSLPPTHPPT